MSDSDLPEELQHLRNLIDKAKKNVSADVLRDVIKSAADEAPEADVIRMAEFILKLGIEIHKSQGN